MKVFECCGIESITKKTYCRECGKEIINEREVPDRGTVFSYTVIHVPPAEYIDIAPYNVALVQLENSDAKLTVRILENVEIGDLVQLDSLVDGAYVYKKIC